MEALDKIHACIDIEHWLNEAGFMGDGAAIIQDEKIHVVFNDEEIPELIGQLQVIADTRKMMDAEYWDGLDE